MSPSLPSRFLRSFVALASLALVASGCQSQCVDNADCQKGEYCNASTNKCEPGGTGGGTGGGAMGGGTGGGAMGGGTGGGGDMDAGTGGGGGGGDMDAGTGGGGGDMDAGTGGGGGTDAGMCMANETDCSGTCKDLMTDVDNCGMCGKTCSTNHATPSCTSGACVPQCTTGFADCNMNPDDGCETDLSAPATCGSCSNACTAGAHATASCGAVTDGGVGYECGSTCDTGYGDCDMMASNGCEADLSTPATCGSCGTTCTAGVHATATCTTVADGGMAVECGFTCDTGFGDCDMLASSGCEADFANPATCGSCTNACAGGANAVATCATGTCGLQCSMGFENCDMMAANGCEADLTATATCGTCSNSCGMGEYCVSSACGLCSIAAAGVLSTGTSVMGTLPPGQDDGRLPTPSCATTSDRFEDVWTLDVATAGSYVIETAADTLTDGGTLDTVINLRTACDDSSSTRDIACNDEAFSSSNFSRTGAYLAAGSYYVIVKEWGSGATNGGDYGLSATVTTPSANSTCAGATALTPGTPLTGQDTNGFGPKGGCITTGSTGGLHWYSIDVPAGNRVTVTATPAAAPNNLLGVSMQLLTSCSATTCLSNVTGSGARTLTYDNRTTSAMTLYATVAAQVAGAEGTYDISATLTDLMLSGNAQCSAPTALTVGAAALTGETIQTGGLPLNGVCVTGQSGPVRYYTVDVPAGGAVAVTMTPTGFNGGLRVLNACPATSCLTAADNSSTSGAAETVRLTNAGATTQTYLVAASASTLATTGTYSIQAVTATPPPAVNAFCSGAIALTSGTPVTGTLEAGGMPRTDLCLPNQLGYVHYYSITVPAGNTLHVSALSAGTPRANVGIRILDGCGATSCAGEADLQSSTTATEAAMVANTTMSPINYIVAISAANTNTPAAATYSMTATVAPTPTNAFCSAATALTVGTSQMGEAIAGGTAPVPLCASTQSSAGLGVYYSLTLPAGGWALVRATPVDFNLNLRVFDDCAATVCRAPGSPINVSTSATGAESVLVQNTGTSAAATYLRVGGDITTTTGTFGLQVTPYSSYTKTTVPQACDTLTMGATDLLTGSTTPAVGDDVTTGLLAMPFGFNFFGTPVTQFSAQTNGLIQLWTAAGGTPSNTWTNSLAIPNTSAPNGYAAPFWDDLRYVSTTAVRTETFGTGSARHLTVEWADSTFTTNLTGVERVRFQVQLYETTNVIEFHYCQLDSNGGSTTLPTGSSATIGLEDLDATGGVLHSASTANSVNTTDALRFTPN